MIPLRGNAWLREVWLPEFDVTQHMIDGQDWPLVIVEKWEVNRIGERRYVETRSFVPLPDRDHRQAPKPKPA